jgi:hypothetical protein
MKLYFLFPWDFRHEQGILKKTRMQLKLWADSGLSAQVVFRSSGEFFVLDDKLVEAQPITFEELCRRAIVLRYQWPSLWAIKLIFRTQCVLDIHAFASDEESKNLFEMLYGLLAQRFVNKRVKGAMFVSPDLAGRRLFRSISHKSVCPNGSSITSKPERSLRQRDRVVYSISNSHAWQGLDRLVDLAELTPSITYILLVPSNRICAGLDTPQNLKVVVCTTDSDYENQLGLACVGLGTLAAESSGRTSFSPLKTRDYLALGLPVVLPYDDYQLSDSRCDAVMQFENFSHLVREIDSYKLFVEQSFSREIPAWMATSARLEKTEVCRTSFLNQNFNS